MVVLAPTNAIRNQAVNALREARIPIEHALSVHPGLQRIP